MGALLLGGLLGWGLAAGFVMEARAYHHHASRIAYEEYSQAAFDRARRENKPVFMVVSAVWCFWCKTYEERTLETLEVSRYLNRNFVSIFVDLDQRQDLQHLYVTKGIPTTVIFTPAGEQFLSFSGTLDKEQFLSGLRQVVAKIASREPPPRREQAPSVRNVRELLGAGGADAERKPSALLYRQRHGQFLAVVLDAYDEEYGGFGLDKKYPLGRLMQYLLEAKLRPDGGQAATAALAALKRVAEKLQDPLEGGFYRYDDRRRWGRPRYEKMLVTNVNLARAYQLASGAAKDQGGRAEFARIYRRTLDFLLRTFFSREKGGFYGSLDGSNPKYYRAPAEKRKKMARPALDKTIYSAWNGEAIFVLARIYRDDPSPRLREALTRALEFLRRGLLSPRNGFYGSAKAGGAGAVGGGQLADNSWGALALMTGYRVTGDAAYLEAFKQVLAYVRANLYIPAVGAYRLWNVPSGKGFRKGERTSREVPLEANGVMAFALAKAHEATGNTAYLEQARTLVQTLGRVEPTLFEDDPNDTGKQYLLSFVFQMRTLQYLSQL